MGYAKRPDLSLVVPKLDQGIRDVPPLGKPYERQSTTASCSAVLILKLKSNGTPRGARVLQLGRIIVQHDQAR